MSKNTQSWLMMAIVFIGMAAFTFAAFSIAEAVGHR